MSQLPSFKTLKEMQEFAKAQGLKIDREPRDMTVPRLRSRLALGSRAARVRVRSRAPQAYGQKLQAAMDKRDNLALAEAAEYAERKRAEGEQEAQPALVRPKRRLDVPRGSAASRVPRAPLSDCGTGFSAGLPTPTRGTAQKTYYSR